MAHSNTPVIIDAGPEVTPVAGVSQAAGACYGYDNKALYAAFDAAGACNVYITDGDYTTINTDNSCSFLSEVSAGPWGYNASASNKTTGCSIQKIDGVFYVALSGWLAATSVAGTYIYRDTSVGNDASGPWVLHGTVQSETMQTTNQDGRWDCGAGEILVEGGRWMVAAPDFTTNVVDSTQDGAYHSDDGGATWTQDLNFSWWSLGRETAGESRTLGRWGDDWYLSGIGNVEPGKHYKASDLATWTSLGALGTVNSEGYSWPLSDPGGVFQMTLDTSNTTVMPLYYITAAPESLPAPTMVIADLFPSIPSWLHRGWPAIWNVGPPSAPYWVATHVGLMMGIGESAPEPYDPLVENFEGAPSGSGITIDNTVFTRVVVV